MASSFVDQIPLITYVMQKLSPSTVLDVGKGFGKYAFLIHEYVGIDHAHKPVKGHTLQSQSRVSVDAIEVNSDYDFPHNAGFYRRIFWSDIREIYQSLEIYDVVLMADVIEHLTKEEGLTLLRHFISKGSTCVVSSPKVYFQQKMFESKWEDHLSFWSPRDLKMLGHLEFQNTRSGRVYVIFPSKNRINGFGNSLLEKTKRLVWTVINEVR